MRFRQAVSGITSLGLALASLASSEGRASAQGIAGLIRDAETRASVAAAAVELLGPDETVLASAISSINGFFALVAPGPGTYHVRVWRIGMDTLLHGPMRTEALTLKPPFARQVSMSAAAASPRRPVRERRGAPSAERFVRATMHSRPSSSQWRCDGAIFPVACQRPCLAQSDDPVRVQLVNVVAGLPLAAPSSGGAP
jgi:hypothetical protein